MRTIAVRRVLPGATVAEAVELWFDLARWSSFVDGFGNLDRVQGEWPQPGTRLIWDSRRGGRGRVVERVLAHEAGSAHVVAVEDPQMTGTQTVRFGDAGGGCVIALELVYELKRPGVGGRLADLLFIGRALRDSLRRTLMRFAVELESDRELAAGRP